MKKNFYALFNIEASERASVTLFLIQSIFLGIFYGAYDIGAHALFLEVYPAEMIPKAYALSGGVGIILTWGYSKLQSSIKFSTLSIINLIFIAVIVGLLRFGFVVYNQPALLFTIFILFGPLNIIALLGFWGTVNRMFTLRQGKRLFGLVDAGTIVGVILISYGISILLTFNFSQENFFLISAASVVIALFFQLIIASKYKLNKSSESDEDDETEEKESMSKLMKNKYIRLMSFFVILSMLAAFFIQYSFLAVSKINYPDSNDLAQFFGVFTGSLMLFTLVFKTTVYSKLMKTYGLRISLLISPFLIVIFTIAASLLGGFMGIVKETSGFMFFFLLIALSRLFSKALKDGVEIPSFKLLYQTLKSSIRFEVQAYVDGTINEIAALAAGLLLAGLSILPFFGLLHYSYVLVAILLYWLFVAIKLYDSYKQSLKDSLSEKIFTDDQEIIQAIDDREEMIKTQIEFDLHPIKFCKKIEDGNYDYSVLQRLNRDSLDTILIDVEKYKKLKKDSDLGFALSFLDDYLATDKKIDKNLNSLVKSKDRREKIIAAIYIANNYQEDYFNTLKSFTRDLDVLIRIYAIYGIIQSKENRLTAFLTENLDHPTLYKYAYDALSILGEMTLPYLEQAFHKTGTSIRTQERIIRLFCEIKTDATDYLLTKLTHPSSKIVKQVLLSLKELNYQTSEDLTGRFIQLTEKQIGITGWNMSRYLAVELYSSSELLLNSMKEEIQKNFDDLYLILSLIYDEQSIQHVKTNIESGTAEGASYALELLDIFIHEEIKPKLFALIEDNPYAERIKQLQNFYPVERPEEDEYLLDLINRDINEITPWTKACAINAFIEEDNDIPPDLIAHLFNPFNLLRETAAVKINSLNSEKFLTYLRRTNQEIRSDLDDLFYQQEVKRSKWIFQRILSVMNFNGFKSIQGNSIIDLANIVDGIEIKRGESEEIFADEVIDKCLVLVDGMINIADSTGALSFKPNKNELFISRYVFENKKPEGGIMINAEVDSIVYLMNYEEILYQLFDHPEFMYGLTKQIQGIFNNVY